MTGTDPNRERAEHEASRAIAEAMVESTLELLWPAYRQQVQYAKAGAEFSARVGWGSATYCRFHRKQKRFEIVYGLKMIEAKLKGPRTGGEWTTGREIRGRGYFDGELDPLNLFSQTVCHEFAHVLQVAFDLRGTSRVHNKHFYTLLSQLHEAGWAQTVRSELSIRLEQFGELLDPSTWLERERLAEQRAPDASKFRPGMTVWFEARGRTRRGIVLRVNRNTLSIRPESPEGRVRYWRVRPSCVRPEDRGLDGLPEMPF